MELLQIHFSSILFILKLSFIQNNKSNLTNIENMKFSASKIELSGNEYILY